MGGKASTMWEESSDRVQLAQVWIKRWGGRVAALNSSGLAE